MKKHDLEILYGMDLHETLELNAGMFTCIVTRVIGGWIYNHVRLDSGQMNAVFVPWNNEML